MLAFLIKITFLQMRKNVLKAIDMNTSLYKEVNGTDPSPSVRIPGCLNYKSFTIVIYDHNTNTMVEPVP
jgi:hypothetical protein